MPVFVLLAVVLAFGGDASPVRGVRTVKVDLFLMDAAHSFVSPGRAVSGGYSRPELQQWTAVLSCAPARKNLEHCSFLEEISYTVKDGVFDRPTSVSLPVLPVIELDWSERGTLRTFPHIAGDDLAFRNAAADAFAQLVYFSRQDTIFMPNDRREVGLEMQDAFVRWLGASLGWELPPHGLTNPGVWPLRAPPIFARKWLHGTAYNDIKSASAMHDGQWRLHMEGTLTEVLGVGGEGKPAKVITGVLGSATWDPTVGAVTSLHIQTFRGPQRTITLVQPWRQGQPSTPAAVPHSMLAPKDVP